MKSFIKSKWGRICLVSLLVLLLALGALIGYLKYLGNQSHQRNMVIAEDIYQRSFLNNAMDYDHFYFSPTYELILETPDAIIVLTLYQDSLDGTLKIESGGELVIYLASMETDAIVIDIDGGFYLPYEVLPINAVKYAQIDIEETKYYESEMSTRVNGVITMGNSDFADGVETLISVSAPLVEIDYSAFNKIDFSFSYHSLSVATITNTYRPNETIKIQESNPREIYGA